MLLSGPKGKMEPVAVSASPVMIETDDSIRKILAQIDDSVMANNMSLITALKQLEPIPEGSSNESIQGILEIYRAFESGKFSMISCHRYPYNDGSGDHAVTIRFTPPEA